LARHYRFVDLDSFLKLSKQGFGLKGKPLCHLTFDDGLAECATTISPILKEKGIPATFFINSAFVDNKEMLFRMKASLLIDRWNKQPRPVNTHKKIAAQLGLTANESITKAWLNIGYTERNGLERCAEILSIDFANYLQVQQPYLTWEQLKTLHRDGFSIGAHSHDHPEFRFLPVGSQLEQVKLCLDEIHAHLGIAAKAFSFPFTDHGVSIDFFERLHQTSSIEVTFGTAGMKKDSAPSNFQRVAMETGRAAQYTIQKAKLKCMARTALGINTINR
jgi:peptidoglycan/xylan/chitin deacetylase (PgdA/CDA1 family)